MGKIVYQEMKKIFMRSALRVVLLLFFLTAVYLAGFIPGGISYYYDVDQDELVELATSFYLEREYTEQLKGTLTDEVLARFYNEYQELINDINNYSDSINVREERDRRYELLGEGYSAEEIDQIDEEEPIYELKPYIKYNKLWKYQPIKHLFSIDHSRASYPVLRELLSEGSLFDWCGGYSHAIKLASRIFSIFIGILVILGVSTIFSEESQYKLDGMISTTVCGKEKVIYGKIISSALYTVIVVAVMLSLDLIVSEIVYGLGNGSVYIQMSAGFMDYKVLITHSRLFWEEWICICVGALYLNVVVLLISSVSRSDFGAVLTAAIVYLASNMGTLFLNTQGDKWKLFLPTTLMRPLVYFAENDSLWPVIAWGAVFSVIGIMVVVLIGRKKSFQYLFSQIKAGKVNI